MDPRRPAEENRRAPPAQEADSGPAREHRAPSRTPFRLLLLLLGVVIVAHLAEEIATAAAAQLPGSARFLLGCLVLVSVLGPALYAFAYLPLAHRTRAEQLTARQLHATNETLRSEAAERERVQGELQRERDQLRNILDAMEDPVCIITPERRFAYTNPVAEATFGPVAGRPCHEYFHGLTGPCPWCRNEEVFAGATVKWEWEPPGTGRAYEILDTPVRLADGGAAKLEILHDVTARRETERRLREDEVQLRASREELRGLAAHLSSVREEERARVARQMHDEMSQVLAALKMQVSGFLTRVKALAPGVDLAWDEVAGLIDGAAASVQRLGTELRPGILDDLGLCAAMEWEASRFQAREEIPCSVACADLPAGLGREPATGLFRAFQEALGNVARHAGASRVTARLDAGNGRVTLTVRDDGRGITGEDRDRPGAFGLLALRENALALRGDLAVEGTPGRGTTLTVWVPVDGAPEAQGRDDRGIS